MKIKKIKFFFIKSLSDNYLKNTLNSLKKTIPSRLEIDYTIIKELDQREKTLNHILEIRDKNEDIFIVADDIEFIDGWFESLENNYFKGDIIGFSTLFPNSNKVQDYGYDFIQINNDLTYRGLYKNHDLDNVNIDKPRICDAICGCAMFIKSDVFNKVPSFSLDGNNRVGEIIYSHEAKRKGLKTIVLNSFLFHGGISTKVNKNINLSSISWLYEKESWKNNVKKYFYDVVPSINYTMLLSDELIDIISSSKNINIYGCGTIADFILSQKIASKFTISSGLSEEVGKKFHKNLVEDIKKINLNDFDFTLITSIGYENEIINSYFNNKINSTVTMKKEIINNKIILNLIK